MSRYWNNKSNRKEDLYDHFISCTESVGNAPPPIRDQIRKGKVTLLTEGPQQEHSTHGPEESEASSLRAEAGQQTWLRPGAGVGCLDPDQ